MKKLKSAIFGLLLTLFFSPWLYAEQGQGFITTPNTTTSETQSKRQGQENYNDSSAMSPSNLNGQKPPLLSPSNPWEDLRRLIDDGMRGLSESNEALTQLEAELGTLRAETQLQRQLLEESKRLVISLRKSLEEAQASVDVAIDRMRDAEGYALWMDAQNEMLKREAAKYRKSAIIGFSFGGVSFGVGAPLFIEGVRTDNQAMMWSGVGIAGAGALVWVAGHYIFQWW